MTNDALMKRTFAAIVFGLMLASPAGAGMKEAGVAYKEGDYKTALVHLRPLAEEGDLGAQLFLATMYEDGRGVPRDYVQAYKWYTITAVEGDQTFLIFRLRVAENMTPAQIAEAQKLAHEWTEAYDKRQGK